MPSEVSTSKNQLRKLFFDNMLQGCLAFMGQKHEWECKCKKAKDEYFREAGWPYSHWGSQHNVHSLRFISGATQCQPIDSQHRMVACKDDSSNVAIYRQTPQTSSWWLSRLSKPVKRTRYCFLAIPFLLKIRQGKGLGSDLNETMCSKERQALSHVLKGHQFLTLISSITSTKSSFSFSIKLSGISFYLCDAVIKGQFLASFWHRNLSYTTIWWYNPWLILQGFSSNFSGEWLLDR